MSETMDLETVAKIGANLIASQMAQPLEMLLDCLVINLIKTDAIMPDLLERQLADMIPLLRESQLGSSGARLLRRYQQIAHRAAHDPAFRAMIEALSYKEPTRPDWFRGVIEGGKLREDDE